MVQQLVYGLPVMAVCRAVAFITGKKSKVKSNKSGPTDLSAVIIG